MTPADPRVLLRKYGLRAKHSWGQNFLTDPNAHDRIVAAAALTADDWVVEIGAGLGTLTVRLAERAHRVIAIERDRQLCSVLRSELAPYPAIEIAEANALTFDYAAARKQAGGRRLVVVGNLPYQIATPLLLGLRVAHADVSRAVLMLQLEMAQRIVAQPATADYGALSVAVQTYADATLCFRVGRRAFFPAPRVESAVLRLVPRDATRVDVEDPRLYEQVVRAAFGKRRKTLRNALRDWVAVPALDAALADAAIEGTRRGETLSLAEFARLTRALRRTGAELPDA